MLLVQVLLLTLLTLPFTVLTFYLSITFYQEKPIVQMATEGFIFNIFLTVAFIPNCISFFLFTLSGSLFRETFIDIGKKMIQHLRCDH
jgi:ABC-type molybdate transport system permease subunit